MPSGNFPVGYPLNFNNNNNNINGPILHNYRRVSRNALPVVTRDARWQTQPASLSYSEVLSCKLRLCSPIPFGFSPCECVKRNPSFQPSSCGELKWVKMSDLRAFAGEILLSRSIATVFLFHGSASISYFENFVCKWFSDHPLR